MIRIAAKLFMGPTSYIMPDHRWCMALLFGRPCAKSNLSSLSQMPKNRAIYIKKSPKYPKNHQDIPESRETVHQSAAVYHNQVATLKYLGYRLEMSTINPLFHEFDRSAEKWTLGSVDNRPLAWHTAAAKALHWNSIRPVILLDGI